MKNKEIGKIFKVLFLSLVVYFITFYLTTKNDYYSYQNNKRKVYTEEQIKKFEEDIKNNKEIDIEKYLQYEDKVSKYGLKIGLSLSQKIEKYTKLGIESAFKMLNNFIDN